MRSSEGDPLVGLLLGLLEEWLMIEAGDSWLHIVSLSHVEVLSEVLVSAPPVGMDHTCLLISSDLMEVGVSHVVLLSISWESSVGVRWSMLRVDLTNVPLPLVDHTLFLLLGKEEKNK